MAYDPSKSIELYLLRAENFKEDIAPNQKQYYLEAAEYLRQNSFDSLEEATEAMSHTKFYDGAGIAKIADDIGLRIKAMEDAHYDDAAEIHRERARKFAERGNEYAFSQEWLDDYARVSEKMKEYAERKEIFGRIFSGYFEISVNPQSDHRKRAAQDVQAALGELESRGLDFDEMAATEVYRALTLTTDKGMEDFIEFIHEFREKGDAFEDDISDIKAEQEALGKWAKEHRQELIEVGRSEKWMDAACVAVPSDDPMGYDYFALKEVKD
jgi:hypothetical protein